MRVLGFHSINLHCADGRQRRERSVSVVECLTRDRRAAGSSLTGVSALNLEQDTLILA